MKQFVLLLLFAFAAATDEESPMRAPTAGDFDTILTHIGIGKWNAMHYIVIAYGKLILPYHALGGAFLSPFVNHTCRPPAHTLAPTIVLPSNVTAVVQNATTNTMDVSFPYDASCSYLEEDIVTGRLEEVPCTQWDFDNSTFSSTVTSEFGLVCERQYFRAAYQSMYMAGFLVGSFFGGYLAYRFGRLTMIAISTTSYTVIALGSAWLPSLGFLLASRFLLGAMHPINLVTGFIMITEITEIKWRAMMSMMTGTAWSVGTILWGIFAYLERDWRWLQTYVSLICPIMLPFLFFLNESSRWLVVTGRHKEALSVLRRAAKMNGTRLPPTDHLLGIMKKVQQQSTSGSTKATSQSITSMARDALNQIALLFSTRKLTTVTVSTCIGFFSVAMIFFGLTLAASALDINDPFTFMVISGLVELPSFFAVFIVEKSGRKKLGIGIFALCAVSLLVQPLIPTSK